MMKLICCECKKENDSKSTKNGKVRLLTGWKSLKDRLFCPDCWGKRYSLRSICIPIAGVVGKEFAAFSQALHACWDQSTALANWTITELSKRDAPRMPGQKRLAAMPFVYLYPEARQLFPDMASKAMAAILQAVQKGYRNARFSVVWLRESSHPSFRYPMPYMVNNQGWKPRLEDGVLLIELRLLNEDYILRLRGGFNYSRQRAAFEKIVSGEAIKGDISLYRQRANSGDHRSGFQDRRPGGGNRANFRIMVKITAWLPRSEVAKRKTGILEVTNGPDAFLVARSMGRTPWILNADHVRSWVQRHRWTLDRLAEDSKCDSGQPTRKRRRIGTRRAAVVARHRRRIETFCHEASAMLTGLAHRMAVEEVIFRAAEQPFVSEFPWFRFKELLAMKLDDRGIRLSEPQEIAPLQAVAA